MASALPLSFYRNPAVTSAAVREELKTVKADSNR
jgi:hypothetical protein